MRLSDACEINPRSQAVSDDTLVSFVAMPDVSEDGKINTSIVRPYGEVKKGYTVFQEGDILFAKITPCMENGKGALAVGLQNGIGVGSTEFHVLRPNTDLFDGMWLYYLTAWPAFRHEAEIHMTGSAGQKRVPKTFLERYQLAIPTLDEQKDQVSQLERIRRIIDSRQRQLRTLDTLIKARFVEMFGLPGTDVHGWGLSLLGKCCELNPKKGSDPRLTAGLQVSFVPMTAVSESGTIDVSEIRTYDEVKTGFTYFAENDVLFAKITPCMENGKGAVAVGLTNGIGFGSTEFHILRPIASRSNPYWIYTLMSFDSFRKDAAANMTGSAGQRRVPVTFLERFKIALPPIQLQEQFAAFVSQVDKSKLSIQQSLEKLETLKQSLMQQYFG